jgi:hypothetical protein
MPNVLVPSVTPTPAIQTNLSLSQLATGTWPSGTPQLQITGLANKDFLVLQIQNGTINTGGGYSISLRLNNDSGAAKYATTSWDVNSASTPTIGNNYSTATSEITLAGPLSTAGNLYSFIKIQNNKQTGFKDIMFNSHYSNSGSQNEGRVGQGMYLGTTQTTSIEIFSSVNFNGTGSYILWGA